MTLATIRAGLAAAVALAVAVGCAGLPTPGAPDTSKESAAPAPVYPQSSAGGTHPISAFLAAARPGDATYLTLPESGQRVHVTASEVYFAASGRYCRRYIVTAQNSPTTVTPGLACKNGHDDWELNDLLVNPSDLNAPQRTLTPP